MGSSKLQDDPSLAARAADGHEVPRGTLVVVQDHVPVVDLAARIEALADEYLARCQSEAFAGVVLHGDVKIGDRARADVFEMRHLRIGKVAPEIQGEDIDGVPFKLSDYRGKVVMLDFWGDW